MKLGTKAVLFGVHQFLLHPLTVLLAWLSVYRSMPDMRELGAIALHDIGYVGCRDLDGPEGRYHPILGARIASRIFGVEAGDLALAHSRTYAEEAGLPISKLCLPDKLAVFFYPDWLYTFLARMSGEMSEFQAYLGLHDRDRHLVIHAFRITAFNWAISNSSSVDIQQRLNLSFQKQVRKSRRALREVAHLRRRKVCCV